MATCLTDQNVCDHLDERADGILDEVDLTDTHVLDSRSVNTTEHSDINGHLDSVNDNVSLVGNQVSADVDILRGEHSGITGGISSLSTQLGNTRNDLLSSFTDTDAAIAAIAPLITAEASGTNGLITTRSNTIDGEIATANSRLNALTDGGAYSLHGVQDTLHNDHSTIEGQNTANAALLTALTAALAAQRRAQPSYSVVAETDWDQALDWNQPADFYLVTITSVGAQQGSQPSGVMRYPHVGWCSVKGPGGASSSLEQLDFANRVITSEAVVPQGLLLFCKPATLGHVQACVNS